jgi:hypothetical protein
MSPVTQLADDECRCESCAADRLLDAYAAAGKVGPETVRKTRTTLLGPGPIVQRACGCDTFGCPNRERAELAEARADQAEADAVEIVGKLEDEHAALQEVRSSYQGVWDRAYRAGQRAQREHDELRRTGRVTPYRTPYAWVPPIPGSVELHAEPTGFWRKVWEPVSILVAFALGAVTATGWPW